MSRGSEPGAGLRGPLRGVITGRILVVDDQENMCWILDKLLTARGHTVRTAASQAGALIRVEGFDCQVAVVDYRLPDANGLNLLAALRVLFPGICPILMTSYGSVELRSSAARHGGVYFDKPFCNDLMIRAIECAIVGARSCRPELIPGIDSVTLPPAPAGPASEPISADISAASGGDRRGTTRALPSITGSQKTRPF